MSHCTQCKASWGDHLKSEGNEILYSQFMKGAALVHCLRCLLEFGVLTATHTCRFSSPLRSISTNQHDHRPTLQQTIHLFSITVQQKDLLSQQTMLQEVELHCVVLVCSVDPVYYLDNECCTLSTASPVMKWLTVVLGLVYSMWRLLLGELGSSCRLSNNSARTVKYR